MPVTNTTVGEQDFADNLATDLAPLLSLLGGPVIRQFLSLSIGWPDHILLAIGSIGIITIIASAIRIAGPGWLKTCIGRAREERSTVEIELQTSTSDEVCELWTSGGIVRTKGQLPDKTITTLFLTDKDSVLTAPNALAEYYLKNGNPKGTQPASPGTYELVDSAPNLTLNLWNVDGLQHISRVLALVGIVADVVMLVMAGIITYRWKRSETAGYAYPCFVVGSVFVFLGLLGCGRAIDAATEERTWQCGPLHRGRILVIWLQRACTVGDQQFPGAVLLGHLKNPDVRRSMRRADTKSLQRTLVVSSVLAALVGFVVQFVGVWALHFHISLMQLGLTFFMSILRIVARRGLFLRTQTLEVVDSLELASFCLAFEHGKPHLPQEFGRLAQRIEAWKTWSPNTHCGWGLATGRVELPSSAADTIHIRHQPPPLVERLQSSTQPQANDATLNEIELFRSLSDRTPNLVTPEVEECVSRLMTGIERVTRLMGVLASSALSEVIFKHEPIFKDPGDGFNRPPSFVTWKVPMIRDVDSAASLGHTQTINLQLESCEFSHSASSTLQAGLSFWLHTSATRLEKGSQRLRQNGFYAPRKFRRVLGVNNPHRLRSGYSKSVLEGWIGRRVVLADVKRAPGGDEGNQQKDNPRRNTQCFGLHLLADPFRHQRRGRRGDARLLAEDDGNGHPPCGVTGLRRDNGGSVHRGPAHTQELYSLFMLAMAAEIKSIGPSTATPPSPRSETPRLWENRLISRLAEIAVDRNIVDNLEEGLMLVVPAFAHHGLLPGRMPAARRHPPGSRSAGVRLAPSLESVLDEDYRTGTGVPFGVAENASGDYWGYEDAWPDHDTGAEEGREDVATR